MTLPQISHQPFDLPSIGLDNFRDEVVPGDLAILVVNGQPVTDTPGGIAKTRCQRRTDIHSFVIAYNCAKDIEACLNVFRASCPRRKHFHHGTQSKPRANSSSARRISSSRTSCSRARTFLRNISLSAGSS